MNLPTLAVILPAAGRSVRYGTPHSKVLEILNNQTVIARAVAPFLLSSHVAHIEVATREEDVFRNAINSNDPRIHFGPGGENRAESVLAALKRIPETIEWIAVHDAARPLISSKLIEETFAAAQQYGAAVPALPAALTIKQATGPLPAKVEQTLPRHTLWTMQTPQIMRRTDLLLAYNECPIALDKITDDVQLLELIHLPVYLVQGEESNLKITTAIDLKLAEMWLNKAP